MVEMFTGAVEDSPWEWAKGRRRFFTSMGRDTVVGVVSALVVAVLSKYLGVQDWAQTLGIALISGLVVGVGLPNAETLFWLSRRKSVLMDEENQRLAEQLRLEREKTNSGSLGRVKPLRLDFDVPSGAPYYEEYSIQRVTTTASGQQIPSGPKSVKQVYRVCARNVGATSIANVSVTLVRFEPALPRYNDLPLHQMHDVGVNGVCQQTFSLGPSDHQFVDLFFKHSVDNFFQVCHVLSHLNQAITGDSYRAIVAVKGGDAAPTLYTFNVRVESDRLLVELAP